MFLLKKKKQKQKKKKIKRLSDFSDLVFLCPFQHSLSDIKMLACDNERFFALKPYIVMGRILSLVAFTLRSPGHFKHFSRKLTTCISISKQSHERS